ncbi:MAG: NDP-sugar synthase [Gemmatimonadaceae bacterium]
MRIANGSNNGARLFGGGEVWGIVLAGSYDRGDQSVTQFLRRPMLPLVQTPTICYPLQWLRAAGIRSAVICANTSTPELRLPLATVAELDVHLTYSVEAHPRGPAGCVRDAGLMSDGARFVVVEASTIPALDLRELLDAHEASGAAVTTVTEVEQRRTRPSSHLRRPGGVYVFERDVLSRIAPMGFQDIKQGLLDRLHAEGVRVHAHEVLGISSRILDFASYMSVSRWIIGHPEKRTLFLTDFTPVGEGLHHPTAQVSASARLVGPVILGANVKVEPHAVIVGPTSIGRDCVIGKMSVITRSVLLSSVTVGAEASIDSSLVTDGVSIPNRFEISGALQSESPPFTSLASRKRSSDMDPPPTATKSGVTRFPVRSR